MTNTKKQVQLYTTPSERDLYESLAEIYSIIVTLDALERAYLKDSIPEAEYTDTCNRLLKQYKSNLADEIVAKRFKDLESFKAEWKVSLYSSFISLPILLLPSLDISTAGSYHWFIHTHPVLMTYIYITRCFISQLSSQCHFHRQTLTVTARCSKGDGSHKTRSPSHSRRFSIFIVPCQS